MFGRQRLDNLRTVPYDELVARYFQRPEHEQVISPSGVRYDLSIETFWDSPDSHNLRVLVVVDDSKRRFRRVPSESFIIAPDGSFIGDGMRVQLSNGQITSAGSCPEKSGCPTYPVIGNSPHGDRDGSLGTWLLTTTGGSRVRRDTSRERPSIGGLGHRIGRTGTTTTASSAGFTSGITCSRMTPRPSLNDGPVRTGPIGYAGHASRIFGSDSTFRWTRPLPDAHRPGDRGQAHAFAILDVSRWIPCPSLRSPSPSRPPSRSRIR
jgi:hypothetical protein